MEKILLKINDLIDTYESGTWVSVENLRIMLRELSSNYYYLTKHNIEFAQKWNKEVYKFNGSNAAGVTFADLTVPELRITRKILYATSKVIDAIRSEIAILRTENN